MEGEGGEGLTSIRGVEDGEKSWKLLTTCLQLTESLRSTCLLACSSRKSARHSKLSTRLCVLMSHATVQFSLPEKKVVVKDLQLSAKNAVHLMPLLSCLILAGSCSSVFDPPSWR